MMRENSFGNIPRLFQIFYGEVASLQSYGAFVRIPGCRKQGLIHISQMSNVRVEDPSEMLAKGERVYCKVIAMEGDGQKISLSMKVVNQTTGQDLDPNNVQSSQDEKKRRQWNIRGSRRIELGAELNTTCRRCGGHGHLAMDCFVARGNNHYELIPELDRLLEPGDEISHRKKDKKNKKKQKAKKRRTSSSSSSKDSTSEDDHGKKSIKCFSGSSSRGVKRRCYDSENSSDSDQMESGRGEKHSSKDRPREKNKRDKNYGRQRSDNIRSNSDSDTKDYRRKMCGRNRDDKQSAHKAWQQDEIIEQADRGIQRSISRRETDMTGGRHQNKSSEHQREFGRKQYQSESSSNEDRIKNKRDGVFRQKSESRRRYIETNRERDNFDRRPVFTTNKKNSERHRNEKY